MSVRSITVLTSGNYCLVECAEARIRTGKPIARVPAIQRPRGLVNASDMISKRSPSKQQRLSRNATLALNGSKFELRY